MGYCEKRLNIVIINLVSLAQLCQLREGPALHRHGARLCRACITLITRFTRDTHVTRILHSSRISHVEFRFLVTD